MAGVNPTPQRISEAICDYGMRHEYDTLGRAIRSMDANGNKTLLYYDRENRLTHTINVIGQSANNTLAGEVSETKYSSFGQRESVRQYATRLADADMDQLLAGGGGGFVDQFLPEHAGGTGRHGTSTHVTSCELRPQADGWCEEVDGEGGVTVNIYNAHGELVGAGALALRRVGARPRSSTTTSNGRVVSQTDDVGGINANTPVGVRRFRPRHPVRRRSGQRHHDRLPGQRRVRSSSPIRSTAKPQPNTTRLAACSARPMRWASNDLMRTTTSTRSVTVTTPERRHT